MKERERKRLAISAATNRRIQQFYQEFGMYPWRTAMMPQAAALAAGSACMADPDAWFAGVEVAWGSKEGRRVVWRFGLQGLAARSCAGPSDNAKSPLGLADRSLGHCLFFWGDFFWRIFK